MGVNEQEMLTALCGKVDRAVDRVEQVAEKANRMSEKVEKTFISVFGAEGSGGLFSWVRDIQSENSRIKEEIGTIKGQMQFEKGRLIAIPATISVLISVLAFLAQWFSKAH
jgi:hypothetical protein